jgi:archaellum component FlaC
MPRHNKTQRVHKEHLPKNIATFHGVHEWFVYVHEKLGWMVLAKAKGMNYKIETYKKSIEHLVETLEHLMTEYEEKDRLHDLNVLHMQTLTLHSFVMKNL